MIFIRTSYALGGATTTSSICNGSPPALLTAATCYHTIRQIYRYCKLNCAKSDREIRAHEIYQHASTFALDWFYGVGGGHGVFVFCFLSSKVRNKVDERGLYLY